MNSLCTYYGTMQESRIAVRNITFRFCAERRDSADLILTDCGVEPGAFDEFGTHSAGQDRKPAVMLLDEGWCCSATAPFDNDTGHCVHRSASTLHFAPLRMFNDLAFQTGIYFYLHV